MHDNNTKTGVIVISIVVAIAISIVVAVVVAVVIIEKKENEEE